MSLFTVTPIPAFDDNYLWLIESEAECWVVDPGDGLAVKKVLETKNRVLTGILVTHHHSDHVGGISLLKTEGMPVIGPSITPHPLVNDPVQHNDVRTICGVEFTVLFVPGHTLNHIAYYAEYSPIAETKKQILFCGDTLFSAGCGRLFEGTAEQMNRSLKILAGLPSETLVYCAHEYTLNNLEFALTLEPNNQDLIKRYQEVSDLREKGLYSIPTSIDQELKTNPFLRTHETELIQSARRFDPTLAPNSDSVFSLIRSMKDSF